METINWTTARINEILPEEFYELVSSNKTHISKTFPGTLGGCTDLEATISFIKNNIAAEKTGKTIFSISGTLQLKNSSATSASKKSIIKS